MSITVELSTVQVWSYSIAALLLVVGCVLAWKWTKTPPSKIASRQGS